MSNEDIIRAWKDEDYSNSLSEEQRSQLPENPAGIAELSEQEMETIQGGDVGKNATGCVCPGTNQYTCGIVCIPPKYTYDIVCISPK
jgi:mersacidin/lichenicidin family type 2 lantibiotic